MTNMSASSGTHEFRESLPLHDRASFWAVVAAAPAVVGGIFVGVGLAQFAKPGAQNDLWAYGWFKLGIALIVVAALVLNFALILYFAHRHAEKHIVAFRAAGPTLIPVPGPTGPTGPAGGAGPRGVTGPTGPAGPRPPAETSGVSGDADGLPDFSPEMNWFQEIDRDYDGSKEWNGIIDDWIDTVHSKLEDWNPRNAKRFIASSSFTDVALTVTAGVSGRGDLLEYPELRRLHLARNRLIEIIGSGTK